MPEFGKSMGRPTSTSFSKSDFPNFGHKPVKALSSIGGNSSVDQGTDNSVLNDYVNASYIDSTMHKNLLIAASAPTKSIVPHFLQMIIENRVTLIMKVCDFKVNGKE